MKTFHILLLSGFLAISCLTCSNAQNEAVSETDLIQQQWLDNLNDGTPITTYYTEGNGLLMNNQIIQGPNALNQQWKKWKANTKGTIGYYKLETHQLRDTEKFELGFYLDEDNKEYFTVIGWRKGTDWKKEFEAVYNAEEHDETGLAKVEKMRQQWEDLSNQHQPEKIANEVCTANGFYFNQGKIYQGAKAITEVYSYMSRDNWAIKLNALSNIQVNKETIFDIGTFQSNGKGLYVLIWKKVDADWKVLLDFNF